MLTDYKLVRVRRDRDGRYVEVVARIYAGDITTEDERGVNWKPVPVTRYRRTALLREVTLMADVLAKVTSEGDVRALLGDELASDNVRSPIEKQVLTVQERSRVGVLKGAGDARK